jgi:hypothetical protein
LHRVTATVALLTMAEGRNTPVSGGQAVGFLAIGMVGFVLTFLGSRTKTTKASTPELERLISGFGEDARAYACRVAALTGAATGLLMPETVCRN